MKRYWLALATVLGLALPAVPAWANLAWTLNCDTTSCSNANNYGSVVLSPGATSGHVTVTVTLGSNYRFADERFGGFGDHSTYALLWNLTNGPAATVAEPVTFSGGNAGHFQADTAANGQFFTGSPFTSGTNCNSGANANSCFDYAVEDNYAPNCFSNCSTIDQSLVFDVTKSGGLSLTDFVKNTLNFSFVAQIASSSPFTGDYFYVGTNQVPEPMTWTMSIAGLMGLAGFAMLQNRRKLVRAA